MLAQQFIDLFPVLSDAHSELTWYWKYLSVPSWNSCGGVVDRENVHLPVIGDLFHLPDTSLDDKVQADMSHREHELDNLLQLSLLKLRVGKRSPHDFLDGEEGDATLRVHQ